MDTRSGIKKTGKSKAIKPNFNYTKQVATNYDYQSGILSAGEQNCFEYLTLFYRVLYTEMCALHFKSLRQLA